MFIYGDQLATPGNLTTNASGNTETETLFLKPGANNPIYVSLISVGGKGAAQTTLNAVALRSLKWATASTGGTGLSSIARDARSPSATATSGSRPTSGTTRTNAGPIVTCGVTSPGLWQTENIDAMPTIPAGNAGSFSIMDVGASASLTFEFALEHREF